MDKGRTNSLIAAFTVCLIGMVFTTGCPKKGPIAPAAPTAVPTAVPTATMTPCVASLIPGCIHVTNYAPVCGCDGVTYTNSAHAGCYGITSYTLGVCP